MKRYVRHYIGFDKTMHSKFPKAYIQDVMKDIVSGAF